MLDLIIGPMFASKSIELKRRLDNRRLALQLSKQPYERALYVRSKIDNRYAPGIITHSGVSDNTGVLVEDLEDVEQLPQFSETKYLFIDEAQFFPGLFNRVLKWVKQGIYVTLAGLDAYANQDLWPEIAKLLPFATTITRLTSVCMRCGSTMATLTCSKQNVTTNAAPRIQVGGHEIYESVCLLCYNYSDENAGRSSAVTKKQLLWNREIE